AVLKGARAIGIAGSREKCDWVTRHARLAACINHRTENLSARLRQLAPHGVDVYFDNVGGALLEAIVAGHHFAPGARVVQNNLPPAEAAGVNGGQLLRINARGSETQPGRVL